MNNEIKKLIKCIYNGISSGCIFFVFICISQSIFGNETFMNNIYNDFTKHALGTILVGMGFGTTPFIYTFKNISMFAKTSIHFIVGMTIFFSTSLYLNWMPFPQKATMLIIEVLISTTIFFAIWAYFYYINKKEAKRINERIKELEKK